MRLPSFLRRRLAIALPVLYQKPIQSTKGKNRRFCPVLARKAKFGNFRLPCRAGRAQAGPGAPGHKRRAPLAPCPGAGKKKKAVLCGGRKRALPLKQKMGHTALPCVFWAFVCFASTAGYAIMKKTGPRGGIIQPCARKKGGELPCFVRTAGRTLRGTSAFARAAGPVWRRQVPPGRAGSSLPAPPRLARRRAGSSLPPPSRLERRRAGSSLFMAAMRQAGRHGL